MKGMMKYKFRPSTIAINENYKSGLYFSFSQVQRDETKNEVNSLKTNKAIRHTDVPTNLIK